MRNGILFVFIFLFTLLLAGTNANANIDQLSNMSTEWIRTGNRMPPRTLLTLFFITRRGW